MNDLPRFLHALNEVTIRRRRARRLAAAVDALVMGSTVALLLSMVIQLIIAHQGGRL